MPVEPATAAILAYIAQLGAPPMETVPAAVARAGFRKVALRTNASLTTIEVAAVEDGHVAGPRGPIPIRIYRSAEAEGGSVPTLVFAHGGGFVVGDIDTHDPEARRLCRDLGCVVVSVDYGLAPEFPFPAGRDDLVAVIAHVAADIGSFGGDANAIAVGGDSAGANLSALAAQRCRDAGQHLAGQLLLYPSIELHEVPTGQYASREANAEGYMLTEPLLRWFHEQYLGEYLGDHLGDHDPDDRSHSPIFGDLGGLAPAVVVTAEFDPLRDEGEAYAAALAASGVPTRVARFDGLIHGFLSQTAFSPVAEEAVATTIAMFRELLHDRVGVQP